MRIHKTHMIVPYICIAGIICIASVNGEWWFLSAIPLVCLGWLCSSLNMNLADGFLAVAVSVLLVAIGKGTSSRLDTLGVVCISSWIFSSIEINIRFKLLKWKKSRNF